MEKKELTLIVGEDIKRGDCLIVADDEKLYVHNKNVIGLIVSRAPKDAKAGDFLTVTYPLWMEAQCPIYIMTSSG